MADLRLLAVQVRYQLTLLLRNPRSLMAGLILPGALLALQLGKGGGTDPAAAHAGPRLRRRGGSARSRRRGPPLGCGRAARVCRAPARRGS